MKNAIVVDANDMKKLLAEHFGVSEDKVIKNQYTYTIITERNEGETK